MYKRQALLRFGHDPNPGSPGTTITQDVNSGTPAPLVDGFSLDVGWYDPADLANNPWLECNGAAITSALAALPAGGPAGGGSGIGTWTKNALDQAQSLIQTADADHPTDGGIGINTGRYYGIIVITDGAWTGPDGINQSPAEDPNQTADDLFNNDNVPTYVVAVDLAGTGLMEADELAAAGGTTEAVEATSPADLITALQQIVVDVQNAVLIPECTAGLPRVMIILDASSSMLNINQGTVNPPLGEAGGAGQTGWDQAREALAGTNSIFDAILPSGEAVEDLVHLGLIVFGSANTPLFPTLTDEQRVLVDYGPCMKDNFEWALNPHCLLYTSPSPRD